jgi:ferredoxin-NADP reductase
MSVGFLAGLFGLIIFSTSLDYCRRKRFNIFFWSHYSFVGYFAFAYLHMPEARTFLLIGASLYAFDRFLRMLWTLVPRKMIIFRNKGDSIAQVRFPKNPITSMLGLHKVGQYYFVNFPRLSLTEWHPFSVSSGPRENAVELHIRALGDHTKEIVKLATERGAENPPTTYIRMDGPYGLHDFNIRRYPVAMIVGGGVGITPVMGILKDIYGVGHYSSKEKQRTYGISHCMETVYAVWIMPNAIDFECFRSEIMECMESSRQHPELPSLVVWVYATREKKKLEEPLISGRPKFGEMFNAVDQNHPGKAALVFACGPGAVVNELWDNCIDRTVKGSRFDFHHETFEF